MIFLVGCLRVRSACISKLRFFACSVFVGRGILPSLIELPRRVDLRKTSAFTAPLVSSDVSSSLALCVLVYAAEKFEYCEQRRPVSEQTDACLRCWLSAGSSGWQHRHDGGEVLAASVCPRGPSYVTGCPWVAFSLMYLRDVFPFHLAPICWIGCPTRPALFQVGF